MFIASHQLSRLRRVHFARFVFTVYVFGQIALSDRRRYFARSVFDKPIAKHFLQTVPLSMLFWHTLHSCMFSSARFPFTPVAEWAKEKSPRREDFSKARRLASFALIDHYSCPASLACSVPRYAFCIPRCPTRENTFVVTGDGFHAILSGNASNGWLSRLALLPATQGLPDAARVSVGLAGLQAQNAKSPLSQFPLESLGRRSSERRLATKSENRLRGLLI